MNIPPFSLFSAISELFVTAGVLYAVIKAVRGGEFAKWLLGGVLLFELCVNIVYMTGRASEADRSVELSTGMKIFFAAHGTLSLLMFLALGITYLWSLYGMSKEGDNWYKSHPRGTWTLVFFWMVSVISGELIFVTRYLI